MQCAYHPDHEAIGACVACGRLICVECKTSLGSKIYCMPCADKISVQNRLEKEVPDTAYRQTSRGEAQAITGKAGPATFATQTTGNTSGQGALSILPDELRGWNWGAFFLTWIWGVGNSVWIAFIAFILGWIWGIVLGIKGNEWAWQSKRWDSIEHFKRTQRTWKRWGIGLFIASLVIGIIYAAIAAVLVITGIGELSF